MKRRIKKKIKSLVAHIGDPEFKNLLLNHINNNKLNSARILVDSKIENSQDNQNIQHLLNELDGIILDELLEQIE